MHVLRLTTFVLALGLSAVCSESVWGQAVGNQGNQGNTGQQANGILVDAQGVVRPTFKPDPNGRLNIKRRTELASNALPSELNVSSPLRKVSLVKLERAYEKHADEKSAVPEEIFFLAGLQRIDYVFVDPEHKDLIIAGPAEGFLLDGHSRALGVSTQRPALRLDDLIVALRALERAGTIGCSIDPIQENLAAFNDYVRNNSTPATPDVIRQRFEGMRQAMGTQDVRIFGVPAETHYGAVLVEADYRMKLLSMELEAPSTPKLRSHLSMVRPGSNAFQRWWFTPLYDPFVKSDDGLAYQFSGQRVQLMSQEEILSADGRRSDANFKKASTHKYAMHFTSQYPQLANTSPIFAELQNLIDLAVMAALLKKEHLAQQVGWEQRLFQDPDRAVVQKYPVPRTVQSTMNYKSVGKAGFIGLVGGGVTINPMQALRENDLKVSPEATTARKTAIEKRNSAADNWWWD